MTDKLRAVWLTDLHLNFLSSSTIASFLKKVGQKQPNIILVTGDTGESHDAFEYLEMISKVAPTWYVLGNHDYWGSSIKSVRKIALERNWTSRSIWLSDLSPVKLTENTTLVGIDGWGDGQCGNAMTSQIWMNDWDRIHELKLASQQGAIERITQLNALGVQEGQRLKEKLDQVESTKNLLVATHVPPFPDACWHNGERSNPNWLPWYACVGVGKVLSDFVIERPDVNVTVLCGHTHGKGVYQHLPNLIVKTGGWDMGVQSYGNPTIQEIFELE